MSSSLCFRKRLLLRSRSPQALQSLVIGKRRGEDESVSHILVRSHMGHAHHHHGQVERGKAGEKIARIGLIADSSLALLKGSAGYMSGSTALIADAAHSMSDIVLSAVALLSLRAGRLPSDKEHPYGHGKFETLGALGISSMLLLTAGGIAWHAVDVIMSVMNTVDLNSWSSVDGDIAHGHDHSDHRHEHGLFGHHHGLDKEHLDFAVSAAVTSIGVKEGLYWATKKVGETQGSQLLKANAWHHRSDAISSMVALIGVGGTIVGIPWLDPAAGLVVSGMIMKAGLETGYHSLQELVDKGVSEAVLAPIRESVLQVEGVVDCHDLRGRRAGSFIYIDAHIEVDPWMSVSAAHNIGEAVRHRIHERHPEVAESYVHIDPAKNWEVDELEESTSSSEVFNNNPAAGKSSNSRLQPSVEKDIREVVSSKFSDIKLRHITCHFLKGKVVVDVQVSMSHDLLIRNAVERAKEIEAAVMAKVPDVSKVTIQLTL